MFGLYQIIFTFFVKASFSGISELVDSYQILVDIANHNDQFGVD